MSQSYESAPQAPPGPPPGGATGPRASFGLRLAAYLIDGVLIAIVLVIAMQIHTILYLIAALGSIAYWVIMEGGPTGQTLGKKAMGIRVYDFRQGGPIGYGRAFLRLLMRIVSGIPIYLGYLWMLWDPEKQTWHDKVAGTVVVPADAYK